METFAQVINVDDQWFIEFATVERVPTEDGKNTNVCVTSTRIAALDYTHAHSVVTAYNRGK